MWRNYGKFLRLGYQTWTQCYHAYTGSFLLRWKKAIENKLMSRYAETLSLTLLYACLSEAISSIMGFTLY